MQFQVQTTALLVSAEKKRNIARRTASAADEVSYIADSLGGMEGFDEIRRRLKEQAGQLESEARSVFGLESGLTRISESYSVCERHIRDNMQYVPVYHRDWQPWNARRIQPHLIFPFPDAVPVSVDPRVITLPGTGSGTNDTLVTLGNAII